MVTEEEVQTKHVKDAVIDLVAGSLGGAALVYVGQPLDTVKVKMQTFPSLYKNMGDCFMNTLRVDGVSRGLYAGTVPALVLNVVENSVLFLCYGFCQKFIQKLSGRENVVELNWAENASAGCIASFFSTIAICPFEVVKCRLQAMHEVQKQSAGEGKRIHIGPMRLTAQIFKQDGIPGFFRGFVPTVVREMPGYFVYFAGYEGTRQLLTKPGQTKDDIGLSKTMVAGAVGGLAFWTLIYPVDVVKSRIQITQRHENMVSLMIKIFKQEGIGALYNGLTPTIVRTIPATAALFASYEYSKKFLHDFF